MAEGKRAQVIQSVRMVRVVVRKKNGVQPVNARVQHLQPQVRRGIDQEPAPLLLHQTGSAAAPVLWVLRVAGAPLPVDQGNSAGTAATQAGDLHRSARARRCRLGKEGEEVLGCNLLQFRGADPF